jgi:nucleoside-diphosphate-sugar epimerase
MRVLVTGGSGFLGSHVVERLLERGHEVRCLVRASSDTSFLRAMRGPEGREVELANGSMSDAASLAEAVRDVDGIVHCAGVIKARTYDEFERVHADGTVALARAAAAHAPRLRRFVHVSTAGVMGPARAGEAHREHDSPNPVTPYSRSKLAGERALLELSSELPITVLRPPAIYGPRDREILAFFQMVRRSRVAFRMGSSMKTMSLVYATDCADACLNALEADVASGRVYFLEDGSTYSFEQMAEAIAQAYGVRVLATPAIPVPVVRAAAAASELFGRVTNQTMMFTRDKLPELLMDHFAVDATAARNELGWTPNVRFEEGARRTAAWYRSQGWD